MKLLDRRWKIGVLIGAYVVLVLTMVWYSMPRALVGARDFQNYQEGQTQRMLESGRQHAEKEAARRADESP
jgi:hypothetical protein